jgi:putative lipoic acid-binding regulatory protein
MTEPDAASPLVFPTDFPIKILGRRVDGFAQAIAAVVVAHAPDFDPAAMEMRTSSEGNWLSLTATVHATSRAQLDDLYRALTSHPLVRLVL